MTAADNSRGGGGGGGGGGEGGAFGIVCLTQWAFSELVGQYIEAALNAGSSTSCTSMQM